jgi:hypothetical protein
MTVVKPSSSSTTGVATGAATGAGAATETATAITGLFQTDFGGGGGEVG